MDDVLLLSDSGAIADNVGRWADKLIDNVLLADSARGEDTGNAPCFAPIKM